MNGREVAAARGPSNRGPRSPTQPPPAQHPAPHTDRNRPENKHLRRHHVMAAEADNSPHPILGLYRPSGPPLSLPHQ
jgi:hypothetical protein